MAIITDALAQLTNLYKILADYNRALSSSVSGSAAYPEFKDTAQFIDYTELQRNCLQAQKDLPRYSNGASIETTHHAVAVLREESMCIMSKRSYVALQAAEASAEAAYYDRQSIFMSNTMAGNTIGASVA